MGQQQLLLIVLGVIIVGIAVVVGINVFTASSVNANRDAVIADLTTLASMAQQYYRKPIAMGGGSQSFDGTGGAGGGTAWDIPAQLDTTANGVYTIQSIAAGTLTLRGVGNEVAEGANYVTVDMDVTANQIQADIVY